MKDNIAILEKPLEATLENILVVASKLTGVPVEDIKSKNNVKRISTARKLYYYLSSLEKRFKQTEIGSYIGRSQGAVTLGNKNAKSLKEKSTAFNFFVESGVKNLENGSYQNWETRSL